MAIFYSEAILRVLDCGGSPPLWPTTDQDCHARASNTTARHEQEIRLPAAAFFTERQIVSFGSTRLSVSMMVHHRGKTVRYSREWTLSNASAEFRWKPPCEMKAQDPALSLC